MFSNIKSPKQALNPAFLKQKPERKEIELFKKEFVTLLDRMNPNENEEYHKNILKDFLNAVYYRDKHYINIKGRTDLVIHNNNETTSAVGVLIETKNPANKTEMIRLGELNSPGMNKTGIICRGDPCGRPNLNVKSLQELVLYYLRERKTEKNLELRYLMITNVYEWFVFDACNFEDTFGSDAELVKQFNAFENKTSAAIRTETFYCDVAAPAIDRHIHKIQYTHFDVRHYEKMIRSADRDDDRNLIALYKFLSPTHLLKLPFAGDNNQLNRAFYTELLHIIGLEEVKERQQKFIRRKKEGRRDAGSLIENAMVRIDSLDKTELLNNPVYGDNREEWLFNAAFDLAITWINRLLFLKLLEAQIVKFNNDNRECAFLSVNKLSDYGDVSSLFFSVLARKTDERPDSLKIRFAYVPYLNSSLFEKTLLEDIAIDVSNLSNTAPIALYSKSVLHSKGVSHTPQMRPLEYLLRFLDAYDFNSEASEDIQDENKPLISASVLGLIFEKINGYREGSFFTPSFITMYMCRETIGRAVIQKFNEVKRWNCQTINDVYNHIGNNTDDVVEANAIFNEIRICDPSVGSGHFLVSALNEMIYLKSELGILTDKNGRKLKDYRVTVENDELMITDFEGAYFNYHPANAESQRVQETFFREKQTIIEKCLFGVDINPNSVKICQLRLWIELLKHTYYIVGAGLAPATNTGQPQELPLLQTLPNIDINIKCGNSLMSRFDLADKYQDVSGLEHKVKQATKKYKEWVALYKQCDNRKTKRQIIKNIENEKAVFYQINNARDPDYQKLKNVRNDLEWHRQSFNFFESKTCEWSAKTTDLTEKVQKSIAAYNEKIRGCFEWRFEFPEVLDDDGNFTGFDVVIGNPPYGIKLDKLQINSLSKEYARWGIASNLNDTYFLFYAMPLQKLLKKNGYLAYIIPNTWKFIESAKMFRKTLFDDFQLIQIVQYLDKIFKEATVDCDIVIVKKSDVKNNIHCRTGKNNIFVKEHFISQSEVAKQDFINLCLTEKDYILKAKIAAQSVFVKDELVIKNGVKPYEEGKGKPVQTKKTMREKPFTAEIKRDDSFSPLIGGSFFHRYRLIWDNDYWIQYGEWLAAPRDKEIFEAEEKLIFRQTSDSIIGTLIGKGFIMRDNTHIVLNKKDSDLNLKYVLALLNSKLVNWYYWTINPEKGEAMAQVKVFHLGLLPIKKILSENQQLFIALVNQILTAKKENPAADTSDLEREIDRLVYELYELTDEEIEIIEKI